MQIIKNNIFWYFIFVRKYSIVKIAIILTGNDGLFSITCFKRESTSLLT